MRRLVISGIALAALAVSAPAFAAPDSGVGAPPIAVPVAPLPPMKPLPPMPQAMPMPMHHDMPPPRMADAQRSESYQRPVFGYRLPPHWASSEYYIADYGRYGLPAPAAGFGWSRYYDDVVLTDQWGRVYDAHSNFDWDRRGHYDYGRNDSEGIAGGFAGAAAGAVAGNLIAGAGSRLAGSLIGGGVGALAGLAIETAISKHHRPRRADYHDYRGYRDDYARGPHWGGYYQGGMSYGYDAPAVTTVIVTNAAPVMSYHTVTTYENVYARRAVRKRHYRPRAKPACVCGS